MFICNECICCLIQCLWLSGVIKLLSRTVIKVYLKEIFVIQRLAILPTCAKSDFIFITFQIVSHRVDRMYFMTGNKLKLKSKYHVEEDDIQHLRELQAARASSRASRYVAVVTCLKVQNMRVLLTRKSCVFFQHLLTLDILTNPLKINFHIICKLYNWPNMSNFKIVW